MVMYSSQSHYKKDLLSKDVCMIMGLHCQVIQQNPCIHLNLKTNHSQFQLTELKYEHNYCMGLQCILKCDIEVCAKCWKDVTKGSIA